MIFPGDSQNLQNSKLEIFKNSPKEIIYGIKNTLPNFIDRVSKFII